MNIKGCLGSAMQTTSPNLVHIGSGSMGAAKVFAPNSFSNGDIGDPMTSENGGSNTVAPPNLE